MPASILPVRDKKWCPSCGAVTVPATRTRGSFIAEIALWAACLAIAFGFSAWLVLLLPAAFTLFRVSTRYQGCRNCGLAGVVPIGSPRAQEALRGTEWEGWGVVGGGRERLKRELEQQRQG